MPKRHRRTFDPARAARILRLLGMSNEDFRCLYNRLTGASAYRTDILAWLSGRRQLPDAAVVLLKALVWRARASR